MAELSLLVVEDDLELAALLRELFEGEGWAVEHVPDGPTGLARFRDGGHDVVVLDRGLPGLEGLSLLAAARAYGATTPTLVLSARGEADDRIEGLESGAEDYLVKPFHVGELLARVRALGRRRSGSSRHFTLTAGIFDAEARTVVDPDGGRRPVELSERESQLLAVLAASPNRVFSRADLRDLVFRDADSDVVVDTYVHYCRKKLGRGVVRTLRGAGYRIGST